MKKKKDLKRRGRREAEYVANIKKREIEKMGNQAGGEENKIEEEDLKLLFQFPEGIDRRRELREKYSSSCLSGYSILSTKDSDMPKVSEILNNGTENTKLDKAMGTLYGMVIGDALGYFSKFKNEFLFFSNIELI